MKVIKTNGEEDYCSFAHEVILYDQKDYHILVLYDKYYRKAINVGATKDINKFTKCAEIINNAPLSGFVLDGTELLDEYVELEDDDRLCSCD